MSDVQWSLPVVVSAAAVVAGRAIRVLSTVKVGAAAPTLPCNCVLCRQNQWHAVHCPRLNLWSQAAADISLSSLLCLSPDVPLLLLLLQSHQASLNSVMMKMQYDAARDSQEGVAVKLIDELREQHLKETALAYTVLLTQTAAKRESQQTNTPPSGTAAGGEAAGAGTGGGAGHEPIAFGAKQIDAAVEDFLLQRFQLKVRLVFILGGGRGEGGGGGAAGQGRQKQANAGITVLPLSTAARL